MDADDDQGADTSFTLADVQISSEEASRARELGKSVVILPRRRADDGRGIYGESTIFLAKELRAEDVDVAYLDVADNRLFEVKKSAVAVALVTLVLGIGSTASWDGIKALLRREHGSDKPMELTYIDLRPDGTGKTWTARGSGRDVIKAIDRLQQDRPDAQS